MAASDAQGETIRAALEKAALPVPEGRLLKARWIAGVGDWYVKTESGWLWCREGSREWKACPMGPPGENP